MSVNNEIDDEESRQQPPAAHVMGWDGMGWDRRQVSRSEGAGEEDVAVEDDALGGRRS